MPIGIFIIDVLVLCKIYKYLLSCQFHNFIGSKSINYRNLILNFPTCYKHPYLEKCSQISHFIFYCLLEYFVGIVVNDPWWWAIWSMQRGLNCSCWRISCGPIRTWCYSHPKGWLLHRQFPFPSTSSLLLH